MDDGRDFAAEFRSIQELERKKLLKRPDYQEAIERYRKLANEMEAGEHYGNAIMCHARMAELYGLLQNPHSERRHWLKAASLNRRTPRDGTHHALASECTATNSHEECYNRAAELAFSLGHQLQAGFTYVELASYLAEQQKYGAAHRYFVKAASLIDDDLYALGSVIEGMCKLCRHKLPSAELEEIFRDIHSLWTKLLKRVGEGQSPSGVIRKLECLVVLVSLLQLGNDHESLVEPAQKILHPYRDANFQQSSKLTTMGEKYFIELSGLVKGILDRDVQATTKAHAAMANSLPWWDGEYENLVGRMLSQMPTAAEGAKTLLAPSDTGNETDELERRQQLFELYEGMGEQTTSYDDT